MSDPLWVDPAKRAFPVGAGDLRADVVVVGAGFSGLGAAWAAAEAGASVVVLEARTVASGASGRNAGFLLAGPAMGYTQSVEAIGEAQTLEIWRLTEDNHALLVSLVEADGIECGYLRRGSMSLAASDEEWEAMQEDCRRMTAAGIAACAVDRTSLPQPFDRLYEGGVYYAGNGEIDPGAFLRGLAGRLTGDVSIFEGTRVCDLVEEGGGAVRVRHARGSVVASAAVVATNAYTSALLPAAAIEPTRGQVAATGPLPRVVVPFPMYADRGFQYWRQTSEGRLVVGGWRNLDMAGEVGIEEALAPQVQSAVTAFIARVSPATVERQWAGIMGFTPDHFPLVGRVPGRTNTWLAAGYSGHGVAMAFSCGALASRASLGLDPAIPAAFFPARFSTLL